jgi:hypothetical protein
MRENIENLIEIGSFAIGMSLFITMILIIF